MSGKRPTFIIPVLFIVICAGAFGSDRDGNDAPAFTPHRSNYFVLGLSDFMEDTPECLDTTLMKIGISFKYELFNPGRSGLHIAYSQTMFWDFFEDSQPFTEFNLNPEVFWRFQSGRNVLGDLVIPGIEYLQIGIEHNSTGVAGSGSRGYERLYGTLRLGFGNTVRLTAAGTYFAYPEDFFGDAGFSIETRDFQLHRSNFAFEIGIGFTERFPVRKAALSFGPGGGRNAFDWNLGWQQLDILFFDLLGGIHPFIRIWNGYGESLIRYDEIFLSARLGIALN